MTTTTFDQQEQRRLDALHREWYGSDPQCVHENIVGGDHLQCDMQCDDCGFIFSE